MPEDSDLTQFAERLVHRVRDGAIQVCDQLATGEMRGARGERWRALLADDSARHAIQALIPDIVDEVLFHLLDAMDNGDLPLGWRRVDGTYIALEELGMAEMAGWIAGGGGGWIARFSAQRFFDYLGDITLNDKEDNPMDL